MNDYSRLMKQLLGAAQQGRGLTKSNPMVAAAVVKDGVVIGKGIHRQFGSDHAEIEALKQAGEKAKGAELVVTLEPCTHWGKTPPCVNAIIEAGISKVIFAMEDPNPLQVQKATEVLAKAGIDVVSGIDEAAAKRLNEVFLVNMREQRPFVHAKMALSWDGHIALANGESAYISGPQALKQVHKWRRESDAVVVGVQTVLTDNPQLNVRHGLNKAPYSAPVKVVLDTHAKTPPTARLFDEGRTIVVVGQDTPVPSALSDRAEIWRVPLFKGRIEWQAFLNQCWEKGLWNVMLEGGKQVFTSALETGVVDRVDLMFSPLFLGENGIAVFGGKSPEKLNQTLQFRHTQVKRLGADVHVVGYPKRV